MLEAPAGCNEVFEEMAELDSQSVKLRTGQVLEFLRKGYPENGKFNVAIDLQGNKKTNTLENFLAFVDERIVEAAGGQVSRERLNLIIWNNGGSWLRPLGFAAKAGFEKVYIYQQPVYNELTTNCRVVIRPDETDICFVPNYKCGYSSMWRFFRAHFESCSKKGTQTFSLNSKERLVRGAHEFTFSFVREPSKRLGSFFIDKFCREKGHHNHLDYTEVYQNILGMDHMDPFEFVRFAGSIPADFADRHWKSFYENHLL